MDGPFAWLRLGLPSRAQYAPQLFDEVYYLKHAHLQQINRFNDNPKDAHEEDVVECIVVDIKYVKEGDDSHVHCKVRLLPVRGGSTFAVRYHDSDTEFLVLKKAYERALSMDLAVGVPVQMFWADAEEGKGNFYLGKLTEVKENWKVEMCNAVKVLWDGPDGEETEASPWELFPPGESLSPLDPSDDPAVLAACDKVARWISKDLKQKAKKFEIFIQDPAAQLAGFVDVVPRPMYLDLVYRRCKSIFYRHPEALRRDLESIAKGSAEFNKRSGQPEFVKIADQFGAAVSTLMNSVSDQLFDETRALATEAPTLVDKLGLAEGGSLFMQPVNLEEHPNYTEVIENPMDLATVSALLMRKKYRTLDSLYSDLRLIYNNALTYNAVGTGVYRYAEKGLAKLERDIAKLDAKVIGRGASLRTPRAPRPSLVMKLKPPSSERESTDDTAEAPESSKGKPGRPPKPRDEESPAPKKPGRPPKTPITPNSDNESAVSSKKGKTLLKIRATSRANVVPAGSESQVNIQIYRKILDQLNITDDKKWFASPVDVIGLKLKDYYDIIKVPMDLGTVKDRLEKGVYKSNEAVDSDIRLTFGNAMKYNSSQNAVHIKAKELLESFELMRSKLVGSGVKAEEEPMAEPTTPASARRSSISVSASSREDSWYEHCRNILNTLSRHPRSKNFKVPVTDEIAPNYSQTIKEPMDLGTLREMLESRNIGSKEEFHRLATLIFTNCIAYNGRHAPIADDANRLFEIFNKNYRAKFGAGDQSDAGSASNVTQETRGTGFVAQGSSSGPRETPPKAKDWRAVCHTIIEEMMRDRNMEMFWKTDPERDGLVNYREVVTRPMDLETVQKHLKKKIKSMDEFVEKVLLIFENAFTYHGTASQIGRLANECLLVFYRLADEMSVSHRKVNVSGFPKTQASMAASSTQGPSPDVRGQDWRKVALKIIDRLFRDEECRATFSAPVDAEALGIPHYRTMIQRPMDLGTIKTRLQSKGEIASPSEFIELVNLTFQNCITFNGLSSPYGNMATRLQGVFSTLLSDLGFSFADQESSMVSKISAPRTPAPTAAPTPSSGKGRKKSDWFHKASSILSKLQQEQHAEFFNEPVDPVKMGIPDYFNVISNPMDLGTVARKLAAKDYSLPQEFKADILLVFENATTYNSPESLVHNAANSLKKKFFRAYDDDDMASRVAVNSSEAPVTPAQKPPKATFVLKGPRTPATATAKAAVTPTWKAAALDVLQKLKKKENHHFFANPVNPELDGAPDYFERIETPMSLSEVEKRLMEGTIKSADEFTTWVSLVFDNAVQYNGPNHLVGSAALKLKGDFTKLFKQRLSEATAFPSTPPAALERKQSTGLSVSSLKKEKPPLAQSSNEWVRHAKGMIAQFLKKEKDGHWFSRPVDPVKDGVPEYFSVITEPMDLGTIDAMLKKGEISGHEEFARLVRLTFENCIKFNTLNDYVGKTADIYLKKFENMYAHFVRNMKEGTLKKKPGRPPLEPGAMKTPGRPRGFPEAPQTAPQMRGRPRTTGSWHAGARLILQHLKAKDTMSIFAQPVDPVALNIPDYPNVVKDPMDLGTVESLVGSGKCDNPEEFARLIRLTFDNCILFNGDNEIGRFAVDMKSDFEVLYKKKIEGLLGSTMAKPPTAPGAEWIAVAKEILKKIKNDKKSDEFQRDINQVKATCPQYDDVVKEPMDLVIIGRHLNTGRIKDMEEFCRLMKLTFLNSIKYHTLNADISQDAVVCLIKFVEEVRKITGKKDNDWREKAFGILHFMLDIDPDEHFTVDPLTFNLEGYADMIKEPMSLSWIQRELADGGQIQDSDEFNRCMHLVFINCITYHGRDSDFGNLAYHMKRFYESLRKKRKLEVSSAAEVPSVDLAVKSSLGDGASPGAKWLLCPAEDNWKEGARRLLLKILSEVHGPMFFYHVPDLIPEYSQKIKEPMDFFTIQSMFASGSIASPEEFKRLGSLCFDNCVEFNSNNEDIVVIAREFKKQFDELYSTWVLQPESLVKHETSWLGPARKILQSLSRHPCAHWYNVPVDYVQLGLTHYPVMIKNPMDLGTVGEMVKNKRIGTREEFACLVRLVFTNAMVFNKPEHDVYKVSDSLYQKFNEAFEEKLSAAAIAQSKLNRLDDEGRKEQRRHRSNSVISIECEFDGWQDKAIEMLDKLKDNQIADVYSKPVDTSAPRMHNYLQEVHEPMDLGQITSDLQAGSISSYSEFKRRVRLVFDNSILFHGMNSVYGTLAFTLLNKFEDLHEELLIAQGLKKPPEDVEAIQSQKQSQKRGARVRFGRVISQLLRGPGGKLFAIPVDPEKHGCSDYLEIIKKPMDFGTIEQMVDDGKIESQTEFNDLVELTLTNCLFYNGDSENGLHISEYALKSFKTWEETDPQRANRMSKIRMQCAARIKRRMAEHQRMKREEAGRDVAVDDVADEDDVPLARVNLASKAKDISKNLMKKCAEIVSYLNKADQRHGLLSKGVGLVVGLQEIQRRLRNQLYSVHSDFALDVSTLFRGVLAAVPSKSSIIMEMFSDFNKMYRPIVEQDRLVQLEEMTLRLETKKRVHEDEKPKVDVSKDVENVLAKKDPKKSKYSVPQEIDTNRSSKFSMSFKKRSPSRLGGKVLVEPSPKRLRAFEEDEADDEMELDVPPEYIRWEEKAIHSARAAPKIAPAFVDPVSLLTANGEKKDSRVVTFGFPVKVPEFRREAYALAKGHWKKMFGPCPSGHLLSHDVDIFRKKDNADLLPCQLMMYTLRVMCPEGNWNRGKVAVSVTKDESFDDLETSLASLLSDVEELKNYDDEGDEALTMMYEPARVKSILDSYSDLLSENFHYHPQGFYLSTKTEHRGGLTFLTLKVLGLEGTLSVSYDEWTVPLVGPVQSCIPSR